MTDSNNTPATEEKDAAAASAAPFMSVLKGNPSDAETATLALLFAGMAAAGGAKEDHGPRNDWGRLEEGFNQPHRYVPGTIRNVHFY
ncbi:MAG: acyl-CoA carboxylase epsilon subunit [Corynebacterium sp.]|uniref:acyl-CoA carboxylase epsilon subunit n=1 Tax=Corynebacterium sp. TaxID=1720 RepID=UPI0026DAC659|nr:acyl-CoA carboxylase epsilon subunit [Corynebacterium sp.]MDO5030518.1 acyl-CoA carboxylase epsilon subunit [Corynebacterium sp.]